MMKIFKIITLILSFLVIAGMLIITDYKNLISRNNLAPLLTIIAMIFNILALTLPGKHQAKTK